MTVKEVVARVETDIACDDLMSAVQLALMQAGTYPISVTCHESE